MQETRQTLLEETSELLDALAPVVQRSIDALQHAPNPLLQHLIQQEVELQEDLLQRVEEMKENLNSYLNPPEADSVETDTENKPQEEDLEEESSVPDYPPAESFHDDLHPDEITHGPSPTSLLPIGAASRDPNPLTVNIPEKKLEIRKYYGMHTLIEVIKVLGIEEVRALGIMSNGIPLVAIKDYDRVQQTEVEGYYIAGNSPTAAKVEQIRVIGHLLDIQIKVKQNNVSEEIVKQNNVRKKRQRKLKLVPLF